MKKDFNTWNILKKTIHSHSTRRSFKTGQIFYTSIGTNIGFEEDGKGDKKIRPVLIYKKFNSEIFWGIPLSSFGKKLPFYFKFKFTEKQASYVLLSQLRLFSRKRLLNKTGGISSDDFKQLKKALRALL